MHVRLATKTLAAIEAALVADQGAKFRGFQKQVFPHMGDAYRSEPEEGFRSHLGASKLGAECARHLWYDFHWYHKAAFNGKTLRLFNRGHLEEARFISLLLMIGVQVFQQDAEGRQFRIAELGGHLGGSGDGVGVGVPDNPGGPSVLEFKTHSEKSFEELAGKSWRQVHEGLCDPRKPQIAFDGQGVRAAKFEHYVQMQLYMRKMGIMVALYAAVNKNTDDVYMEIVTLDADFADQFLERGRKIIMMAEPPKKLSNSPGWFACKWCDHRPVCHLGAPAAVNCRTCRYSAPAEDGTWRCNLPSQPDGGGLDYILSKEEQLKGCHNYEVRKC